MLVGRFETAVLPLPPTQQTFTKLDASANNLRLMFLEGRHCQNWSLSTIAAVPDSAMNIQHVYILEDLKADMS